MSESGQLFHQFFAHFGPLRSLASEDKSKWKWRVASTADSSFELIQQNVVVQGLVSCQEKPPNGETRSADGKSVGEVHDVRA